MSRSWILRAAAVAVSRGDDPGLYPEPENPNRAESSYLDAIRLFLAGRQCAGWDAFEFAEQHENGGTNAKNLL